ncbi:MAG TPA: S8 family serine peptidase [Pilimelia sp.]|nr:S8 family serine peptidase [Pilimelia sp.]
MRIYAGGAVTLVLITTLAGQPLVLGTSPVVAAPQSVKPDGAGAAPRPPAARDATVTLITGDRVRLLSRADGQVATAIEPGPGRERIEFAQPFRFNGRQRQLSVIPSDAAPLLAAGRLDPRLFNVTELARQGFTDAAAPALPLIITYARMATARAGLPAAATAVRSLPSVNGAAIEADRWRGNDFWTWLTGGRSAAGPPAGGPPTPTALAAGVGGVWLDARSHPTLDASAPQVGAPAAWQAGLTGAGVTVGVLDTGIKADHPDLAGKVIEQRDFTDSLPGGGDDIGHGTHVAGIIAGTGAASGGRFRGIAPDAKLLSGRVCQWFGCSDSDVIAGMEWIAPQVKVVNMSLGGGSTDGTDPLSQALNNLTAQHGTLFVVSAGNSGGIDQVSSPASADAALAVGSVTKQDATSSFSSRGPRAGDFAVKPDIAAPGSGIVSARAPGTDGGDADPVDANYARLSGTSMAAPHVAGAAAILSQQHPEWTAARFKPTLMSTATPTAGVFDQGAGRLDVARAITQRVTTTGGSLSYGFFAWPHNQPPVAKTVTYRNDGDAAVTLSLDLAVTGPGGGPVPAGLFTISAGQVTVPAHGTADVTVTATPAAGETGQYAGRLTATAPGVTVRTALGAFLEPESYNLNLRLVSRTGQFDSGFGFAVNTATGEAHDLRIGGDGTAVVRLPKGRYDVNAFDISTDPANPAAPTTVTLMSRPNLTLAADVAVTLDARAGKPAKAIVDRPDATNQFGQIGLVSGNPAGDRGGTISFLVRPQRQIFAVPTRGKVTDHTFNFFLRLTMAAARPGTDPSGYVYHLAFLERGRIPANPAYRRPDAELATVDSRYHVQGVPSDGLRFDFARFPVAGTFAQFDFYGHTLPSRRTEFYSAHPDVTWVSNLGVTTAEAQGYEFHESIRTFRPGRQAAGWNRAPIGPAFGAPDSGYGVARAGTKLGVAVTLASGSDPHQAADPASAADGMTGTTTLTRDGVVLGSSAQPGIGEFDIPDAPGTYQLRATADRVVPWSVVGTRVDATWTFHEPGAAAPAAPLPLLVVRAAGAVDDQGRAPAGCHFQLSLTVQRQPGSSRAPLRALTVQASFDDGATWVPVPVSRYGDRGQATVPHPARDGFVSLRIAARDAAGNAVTQTVIRAYQIVAAG